MNFKGHKEEGLPQCAVVPQTNLICVVQIEKIEILPWTIQTTPLLASFMMVERDG